jgi:glycosyltransferase involved in cell wall biosynthesis
VPRATVIIPNYNNGRASSRDGTRDFLGELLASLESTLRSDQTDLEILVADDGSTDDSLSTARAWAARTWPADSPRAGRPFLRLVELKHSGVLSQVLNALHAESSGEYLCRLDGDVILETPDWVARCVELLDAHPGVAVVTGLQKLPDGRVHALGDAIISPLGYHHLGQGLPESELPEIVEVEHAMGCFHASRRKAIAAAGGYDETVLRGQTEELAMRLNLAGWGALATTRVVFRHYHGERHWRPNTADTGEGLQRSLDRFRSKWGFDRLAPDLADVWSRWRGTPLVDRARLVGPRRWSPSDSGDLSAGEEFTRFGADGALQAQIGAELALIRQFDGETAILGARSGLTALLRAGDGVPVTAIEEHEPSIEALAAYRARAPKAQEFLTTCSVPDLGSTGLPDRAFKNLALLDSIERYWNPVGLLREGRRLLAADGYLIVRSRARGARFESRGDTPHLFAAHELYQIVRHSGGFTPLAPPTVDGTGRWQLLARATGSAAHHSHFGA